MNIRRFVNRFRFIRNFKYAQNVRKEKENQVNIELGFNRYFIEYARKHYEILLTELIQVYGFDYSDASIDICNDIIDEMLENKEINVYFEKCNKV